MAIVNNHDTHDTQSLVLGLLEISASARSDADRLKALNDDVDKLTTQKLKLESWLHKVNNHLEKFTTERNAIATRVSEQLSRNNRSTLVFPFHRLPAEIRVMIYKMVMSRCKYDIRGWHRRSRRSDSWFLRFLLTCKLFHNEAVDIAFQELKFWVAFKGPETSNTSVTDQFRAKIGRLPPAKRLHVRTIQVPLNIRLSICSELRVRYLKEIMARVSSPVDDHGLPNVDRVEFFHLRRERTTRMLQFTLVRTAVTEEVEGVQFQVWDVQFEEGCMGKLRRSKALEGDRYFEPVRG
jgi:hypothetical protein